MYELQQYSEALESSVTFPIEIVQQILGILESVFGSEFKRVHGLTPDDILIQSLRVVLEGITPEQIQNGLKNMRTEKYCPTLSGFRALCFQDHDWWTAEMAWAFALNWKKDNTKPITNLAKRTLGEVGEIMNSQGQRAAYNAFIDTYEFNVRQAKKHNCTQVMWVKPNASNNEEKKKQVERRQAERERSGMPCPPELVAQMKGTYRGQVS